MIGRWFFLDHCRIYILFIFYITKVLRFRYRTVFCRGFATVSYITYYIQQISELTKVNFNNFGSKLLYTLYVLEYSSELANFDFDRPATNRKPTLLTGDWIETETETKMS